MMLPPLMAIMAVQAVINLFRLLGMARNTAVVQGMMDVGKTRGVTAPTIDAVGQFVDSVVRA